jgi:hypothetical protein
MTSYEILMALYRIQGASDPNQSPETLAERMAEIYAAACDVMDGTGFEP